MVNTFILFLFSSICFGYYCLKEQKNDIILYTNTSCIDPTIKNLEFVGDYTNYSSFIIDIYSVYSFVKFGSPDKTFQANKVVIQLKQKLNNLYSINFNHIETNFELYLTDNNYLFGGIQLNFCNGNSPTKIIGDVDTLWIYGNDDVKFNYHLPIQRTYFSSTNTMLKLPFSDGIRYLISSYEGTINQITSTSSSDDYFNQTCGGMVRYFSIKNIKFHSATSKCLRSFTKDEEDDFNLFIVTIIMSLLPNYNYYMALSTNNYIIRNNYGTDIHKVYTYPNQWLKYESSNQTTFNIYRKKEPYQRIEFSLTIETSNEGTTSIKEVENNDKSISTVIISSSKPLTDLTKVEFLETTSTKKSQIMIIGMNGITLDSIGYKNCNIMIYKQEIQECIECEKGYYLNSNKECQLLPDNCIVGYKTYCYQCKEGFIKEKGECKEIDNKCNKSERNYCLKCSNGYKIENNQCNGDKEDQCYYEGNECVSCSNRYTLNNGKCSIKEKNQNGKNEEIYCENGKYINNNKCIECSKSEICQTNDIEIKCKYEEYLDNNKCINKTCEEDMIKDQNGKCNNNNNIEYCLNKSYVNGKCVECLNTYSPNLKGECINTKIEYCEEQNTYGCKRCEEGYYLTKDMKCLKCDDKCETCYGTSTYCMSCSNDKYLRNDKTCQSNEELNGTCLRILPDGSGCGICNKGYYRNGKGCSKCEKECLTCNQKDKCIICGEGYFMSSTGICKSTTTIKGCKGEIDKEYGCRECLTGYYLINKECSKCGNKCITCLNEKECNTCEDEYIIINKECIHYSNINKCKETKNNKCSKCSFWYGINEEGTKCNKEIKRKNKRKQQQYLKFHNQISNS
ncbi:hypothetical protein EDI_197320 [Entamoeba dispar SAW760]|uniref:Furin n=1 Tax=Entamoeba dispar (strain ATCC PRA-260 / SAW760) TaxID=370354 RepID=B0ENX0_ENTDS|nr:uncharacterized protein EDI_197320 [Entamoeba dispar SAW760]EDR23778.1 hypothetical protein EDI_197320 [Entamoeba dispar SAW760]|eukprot:EDR23778.1 hypothetical protein EDI_197320 [Entamoeba dispar SAW760]